MHEQSAPPPLLSALAVCHAWPEIEALSHVVVRISECLDWSLLAYWSIPRACAQRHEEEAPSSPERTRLLQRLVQREPPSLHHLYRAAQCSAGLVNAVRNDDVVIMKWLLTIYCPSAYVSKAMEEACRLGNVELLEWIVANHAENILWVTNFADTAAKHSQLAVLAWLDSQDEDVGYSQDALDHAARSGHLEIVQQLWTESDRDNGYILSDTAALFALQSGHIDVAEYLCGGDLKRLGLDARSETDNAAKGGNWRYFRWLHENFDVPQCSVAVMTHAAASGDLELLQWLHVNRSDGCKRQAMDCAARGGHLAVVQWLHTNRREGCTHRAMNLAATRGYLAVVQWLHANRSEGCTSYAMDGAAGAGHLETVQWLHAHRREGCTTNAMDRAAIAGHLAVVQWLHRHRTEGCTVKAMNLAAGNGHLHVVQWLHANRSEGCTTAAMDEAAAANHLEVVQWLHFNRTEGCTTYAMDDAARFNHLAVIQWLHENRYEGCTTAAMDNASSLELVTWLHENRSEGCTPKAMDAAVYAQNFDTLLFLHANRSEGCSHMVVHAVAAHDHIEIFLWLHENYRERLDAILIRWEYFNRKYLNALLDQMGCC